MLGEGGRLTSHNTCQVKDFEQKRRKISLKYMFSLEVKDH